LTINEIPPDDNIELTLGVKLIIFPTYILAFVSQSSFCLTKIFGEFEEEGQDESVDVSILEKHRYYSPLVQYDPRHKIVNPIKQKIHLCNIPVKASVKNELTQ
jgi:hypothetical protein